MRRAEIKRKTAETDVTLSLVLDGEGKSCVSTGSGFFDHMLTLFAAHGRFDLDIKCIGDTDVDLHHSVEDIGICLGKAFAKALGDCKGITRYGSMLLPMDEALVLCALDISGRGMLCSRLEIPTERIGEFDTELVEEFFVAFTRQAGVTLHFRQFAGKNSHHIVEAAFKGFGRAMREATAIDPTRADRIPSTKGMLV